MFRIQFARIMQVFFILVFLTSAVGITPAFAEDPIPETIVTPYFDGRAGAMALNFDTELYLCGMVHTAGGYNPPMPWSAHRRRVSVGRI